MSENPALPESSRKALDEILERGRRAAGRLESERGYRRIYMGGAPTAGLGSPKSDIDLFVVLDSRAPTSSEQLAFEGARVDIEYLELDALRSLVDTCTAFRSTSEDMEQIGYATRSRLDSLTRFVLGEILLDQDGALRDLLDRWADRRADYQRLLVARHATDVENLGDDVTGALLNEDLPGAEYQSREALYRAAEAYLCGRGDYYINTKWLWTKWARTVGDELGAAVSGILRDPRLPSAGDAVSRNLWLAQDLVAMAATGYRYRPVASADPEHCRRQPADSLVPTSDSYLVTQQTASQAVELSRQGVLLWGVAHGRTEQEALRLVQAQLSADGIGVPIEEIGGYYRLLRDHRLIA
ncbi:hypothetical protein [Kitasatospora sp. MAA4]|uniref:hypothetical protein n=1 Tax=Kitasatospora sp. MAA4 TaxID=3035093 RepID=UPI00247652B6|nr:hypothetical protein [Kitasatospora sp. MAA4]